MPIVFASLIGFAIAALLGLGRLRRIERVGALVVVAAAQALFAANYSRGQIDLYNWEERTLMTAIVFLLVDLVLMRAIASARDVWRPGR